MAGSRAMVGGQGWIKSNSGILLPPGCRAGISGMFRFVAEAVGQYPRVDTGWVPNCITEIGVEVLLARFFVYDPEGATNFADYIPGYAGATEPMGEMALGGSDAIVPWDYYDKTTLQDEIAYNTGGRASSSTTPKTLLATRSIGAERETQSVLTLAGSWLANSVCATAATINISEVGIYGSAGGLYTAACFAPVLIAGVQPCSAYYSIRFSQAAYGA